MTNLLYTTLSLTLALAQSPSSRPSDSKEVHPTLEADSELLSLEEIVVVAGARSSEPVGELPFASFELDEDDIVRGRPTFSLAESLGQVPGLLATSRNNFAQDTRISIRGFGARSTFGIRGIRLFLDGIPLTLPDGQSQLDSVDPAYLGRIEVLRGPAGSLYGNSAGGVIYMESRKAAPTPEFEASQMVGAFGAWKWTASAGGQLGGTQATMFASRTQVDGFRDQSKVEQWVVQSRTVTDLSDNLRFSTAVHYYNSPTAEDPGGLTLEQFRDDITQAAAVNEEFDTGEAVSQLQVGSQLVGDWGRHRVELSAHGGLRDFSGEIPFRSIDFTRDFYGALGIYRWAEQDWLKGHRLSLGIEAQFQEDRRSNDRFTDNGEQELILAQTEQAQNLGFFFQEQLDIIRRFTLIGGARYDRVDFNVVDELASNGDASGERVFDRVTGQGGIVYKFQPFSLFANLSQSFETPTLGELVNAAPDGGLSQDLDAQKALSYEVGLRGSLGALFGFETSAYLIELRDELISAEDEQNRAIFSNAGESRRLGAELFWRVRPHRNVSVSCTYAWLRATFEDEQRQGQYIPGLPEHRFFSQLRYDNGELFGAAELEWMGTRFANDDNSVHAPPQTLTDMRVGLRFPALSAWRGEVSLGVRNLFAVRTVDNIRVNAFGDRYFDPGTPLHVYGALKVHFAAFEPLDIRKL